VFKSDGGGDLIYSECSELHYACLYSDHTCQDIHSIATGELFSKVTLCLYRMSYNRAQKMYCCFIKGTVLLVLLSQKK